MRVLRNPVAQFLAAGLIVVVAVALASDRLSREAAEAEAIADARATTELLARAVAEPRMRSGLAWGGSYAQVMFDDEARDQLMIDNVVRVKIWNRLGHDRLVGRAEPDGRRLRPESGGAVGAGLRVDRRGGHGPAPAGERLRGQGRRPARGLHPDRVSRGRAAAVRGLLLRRAARRHHGRPAGRLPPDHRRRHAVPRAAHRAAAVGAQPAPRPRRAGPRAAAPGSRRRLGGGAPADRP